jgi:hypothetical protein
MLALTSLTYWIFYFISLGAVAHLLFKTSYSHAVIIVGFFVLSKFTKKLGEYIFFKDRLKYINALKTQTEAIENLNKENDNVQSK